MNPVEPTLLEWKNCIQAALQFKEKRCWTWITDEMIFGVQNPEDGQIGYCCVMGTSDEMAALSIHLGSEGLEGLQRIRREDLLAEEFMHIQYGLILSFESKELLEEQEITLMNLLGWQGGRQGWPCLRYFEPGFVPWFLNGAQVRFMTIALQQVIEIAESFRFRPERIRQAGSSYYLVRTPLLQNGRLIWTDRWLEPKPVVRTPLRAVRFDELRLRKLQKSLPKRLGVWELDYFYSPIPMRGKDKPYYPKMCLILDHTSGQILLNHLAETADDRSEFVEQWLEMMLRLQGRPYTLLVQRSEVMDCFGAAARVLNVRMERSPQLLYLEEVKMNLYDELAPF
ncbi:hypothetical protein [Paenibacillus sp. J2TS4]|uniref:DUF7309 domain-containing protein n=1 Tax=Paenibacillus sp. J2TS4 TaxID=2807194 RepID=UPI001B2C30C3|nr:hypothetical protein [Paenibacillus sp. J2TS4]GIP35403.1 hypothetical protein J2TS4_46130 [Paenibacillus sp. J2TS4]